MGKPNKPKTEQAPVADLDAALDLDTAELFETQDEVVASSEVVTETAEPDAGLEAAVKETTAPVQAPKETKESEVKSLFKRMAPTRESGDASGRKPRTPVSYKERARLADGVVSHNAALLAFPTDPYGITRELKKAMVNAGARMNGDPNKKAVFDQVLDILKEHVELKFAEQTKARSKLTKEVQPDELDELLGE